LKAVKLYFDRSSVGKKREMGGCNAQEGFTRREEKGRSRRFIIAMDP